MTSRKKENQLRKKFDHVIGIDAAGITAMAGPMMFIALEMTTDTQIRKLTAARKLVSDEDEQYRCFNKIWKKINLMSISEASIDEIKELGEKKAIEIGIRKVIKHFLKAHKLESDKCYFLIDFFDVDNDDINKESIKRGDESEYVLSCASIVGNVIFKQYMKRIHSEYPIYAWNKNFGYKDKEHSDALELHGKSLFHR